MSLTFADRMRSTLLTAMFLGLVVFVLFIPTLLLPLVGVAVWLVLGSYFGSRTAFREHRDRAVTYAILLGAVEGAIVVSTVIGLLHVVRGSIFLAALEWMTISAVFAICIVFSAIGAWTLPD